MTSGEEHGDQARRQRLIERIEALRGELGETRTPRWKSPHAGVSGRNVVAVVAAAERIGVDPEALRRGLSFALGPVANPNRWISWDEFDELLARVGELGGDDALRRLGAQSLHSPLFVTVGAIASTFIDERDLLEWLVALVFRDDGLYFHGVEAHVDSLGPGRLRVVLESRGPTLTRPFAHTIMGIVESLPRLLGRDPAHVQPNVTPDRLVLDMTCDRRTSRLRSLARVFGLGRRRLAGDELRALYDELVETNQRLVEKLDELEASHAARREMEGRLAQVRQMQVVGRFAGALSHQFNNYLTVIGTLSSFVAEGLAEGDPARQDLSDVQELTERAAALTRELRVLGTREPSDTPPLDLERAIRDTLPLLRSLAGPKVQVTIRTDEAPVGARIDPTGVERLLGNLVVNAREAMPDGGKVWIEVRPVTLDEAFVARHPGTKTGDHVLIRVRDDGPGVPESVRARIFEPLFSTKRDQGGSGLGLATVYAIATSAGGTVWVDSGPRRGATFRVYLPQVELDAAPRATAPAAKTTEMGPEAVLFIDDNELLRNATKRILARAGYDVSVAASGDEALELIEAGLRPAIIVSDVVMPGLRGTPLAKALRERLGPIPILFVSGYTDHALDAELGPNTEFLAKPYRPSQLLARIAALMPNEEPPSVREPR